MAPDTDPDHPSDAITPVRPGRRRWWRRLSRAVVLCVLLGLVFSAGSIGWTKWRAKGMVYEVDTVPSAPVAMVLGALVNADGRPSEFLRARLDIALTLYREDKIKAILVSGDHGRWAYDEPGSMRDWLIVQGVPEERVVADYAGFDTYDSCQRAVHVFGVRKMIVVTQSYHIDRAVTLCRSAGIDTVGVGDDSVRRFERFWNRAVLREQGACVKAALDVLSRRDPVFLGPRETSLDPYLD